MTHHARSSGTSPRQLLRPGQVAALFSVDTQTVGRWADDGKLTAVKTLGGHRRYDPAEVYALLAPASAA